MILKETKTFVPFDKYKIRLKFIISCLNPWPGTQIVKFSLVKNIILSNSRKNIFKQYTRLKIFDFALNIFTELHYFKKDQLKWINRDLFVRCVTKFKMPFDTFQHLKVGPKLPIQKLLWLGAKGIHYKWLLKTAKFIDKVWPNNCTVNRN